MTPKEPSDHTQQAVKNIRTAFFLNLFFAIIEVIGGLWTNSIAILSDALHDLGDSLILGISWYLAKVSGRQKTEQFSYGYKRFSLLGAIISSLVLFAGSIFIITEAIPRMLNPEQPNAEGMIWLSLVGIAVNVLAAMRLQSGKTMNERVVYLHLLEDVLGWIATLIGGIVMSFSEIPQLDAVLAIGIACYILFNVFKNLIKSIKIILQGTPPDMSLAKIRENLMQLEEVEQINDCHAWSMDGDYHVLSVHLIVAENKTLKKLNIIKTKARSRLRDMGIDHSTIEFETPDEDYGPC